MLISSLFSHGITFNNMKVSIIRPVPKNVFKVCDSNNYRSIAIGSVLGKIVDRILIKTDVWLPVHVWATIWIQTESFNEYVHPFVERNNFLLYA